MKEQITLKSRIMHYMDAGFPVLYVNTYEEDKVDTILSEINRTYGREIFEWNESNGYVDFETNTPVMEDCGLEQMLDQLKTPVLLEDKIILLKDLPPYLENPRIVSKIKGLARLINQGASATIFIVSSILVIPKDLEKYMTILEMDYLGTDEIKQVILNFKKEVMPEKSIPESLVDEFAVALKGLTEYEILNLLALAYSRRGNFYREDLSLIFDQKQQMIKKAGILEMIPLNETMEDIGGLENLKEWFKRKAKV